METPGDIIRERQRALAGPDESNASLRELERRTADFKGGPLSVSTLSRWTSLTPGRARTRQLELFAKATQDSETPAGVLLKRMQVAFGHIAAGEAPPWEVPEEVKELTADQQVWLTATIRMLARTNRSVSDVSGRAVEDQQQ